MGKPESKKRKQKNADCDEKDNASKRKPCQKRAPSLLDMSNETLLNIFRYLSPRDLKVMGFISERLATLAYDHTLWVHVDARAHPVGVLRFQWMLSHCLHAGTTTFALSGYARDSSGCLGRVSRLRPVMRDNSSSTDQICEGSFNASTATSSTTSPIKLNSVDASTVTNSRDIDRVCGQCNTSGINKLATLYRSSVISINYRTNRTVDNPNSNENGSDESNNAVPEGGNDQNGFLESSDEEVNRPADAAAASDGGRVNEGASTSGKGSDDEPACNGHDEEANEEQDNLPAEEPPMEVDVPENPPPDMVNGGADGEPPRNPQARILEYAGRHPAHIFINAYSNRQLPRFSAAPSWPEDASGSASSEAARAVPPRDNSCRGPLFSVTKQLIQELRIKCPKITELRLEYCNLNHSVCCVSELPRELRVLSLRGSRCFNVPMARSYLFSIHHYLPFLESLDLSECDWLEPDTFLSVSKLEKLTELIARDCRKLTEFVAYASLATRYGFIKVEVLDFRGSPLGDSEVSALGWLRNLRELRLAPAAARAPPAPHTHYRDDPEPPAEYLDSWEWRSPPYLDADAAPGPNPSAGPTNNMIGVEKVICIHPRRNNENERTVIHISYNRQKNEIEVSNDPPTGSDDRLLRIVRQRRRSEQARPRAPPNDDSLPLKKRRIEENEVNAGASCSKAFNDAEEKKEEKKKTKGVKAEETEESKNMDVEPGPSGVNKEVSSKKRPVRAVNSKGGTPKKGSKPGTSSQCVNKGSSKKRQVEAEDSKEGTSKNANKPGTSGQRANKGSSKKRQVQAEDPKEAAPKEEESEEARDDVDADEPQNEANAPRRRRLNINIDVIGNRHRHGVEPVVEEVQRNGREMHEIHILPAEDHPMRNRNVQVHRMRMPFMRNMVYGASFQQQHVNQRTLVSDSAIRRFGRSEAEDIVHIGAMGEIVQGLAPQDNGVLRPSQSTLRVLICSGYTSITNASLVHLASAAPFLRYLDVRDTGVTLEGVNTLKSVRPEIEVLHSCN